jgi:CO dehydrogenase maturation factor
MAQGRQKKLVAVCGKGGSGKTALVALMTKGLIQDGRTRLLVIDADPTMNLAGVLGLRPERTVNDIREQVIREARTAGRSEKEHLARSLDYLLFEALTETDRFSFLVMGRPESLGCYCPVNDFLRDGIETLARSYDVILIDGEAGVEQINRQVMQGVDTLLIVSDLSSRGLETAALIKTVLGAHPEVFRVRQAGLVLNRVRDLGAYTGEAAARTGLELFGVLPEDETVTRLDMAGVPLLELPDNAPVFLAVGPILERVIAGQTKA